MSEQTPMTQDHIQRGAKMVDFAGWNMPVEFHGLREEHNHVRQQVGLFDVSHMGELRVQGEKSLETLQWLTTNDVAKLGKGQAHYSLFPNDQGGIVDDLIVYCIDPGRDYLLCINAANTAKDFAWVQKHNRGADIHDESDHWGQIAVQGPKAMELLSRVFGEEVNSLGSFQFKDFNHSGLMCWVAKTGYTGEEGAEVFVPWETALDLWQELLNEGQDLGAKPIGLGARDTLRTEMKYSLYGHEIDDTTNPYAAGLGWVVKPQAKDFLGKDRILAEKEAGLKHKLIGFEMLERGIPRQGYKLFSFDNQEIGRVTSGTPSPSTGKNIGIAYLERSLAEIDSEFVVEIRQRRVKAKVVKTPFQP